MTVVNLNHEDPKKHVGPVVWMPELEHKAMVEFRASMTMEEHRRFAYFMWNNFSFDGYEEYLEKTDQVQENEK